MKITTLAIAAAAATVVVAQPHAHLHRHRHAHPVKRQVTVTTNVVGPTAYAFMLDNKEISVSEACAGLQAGSFKLNGNVPAGLCSQSSSSSTSSVTTTTTTAAPISSGGAFYGRNSTTTTTASAAPSQSSQDSGLSGGQGVTSSFPDGTISCGTFPSSYGAISLDYLGLGGWSGLQAVTIAGSVVSHIVTGVSGQSCTEGMMCSYACPPGYQKAQWPSTQGATGQSIGGLQCKGGKLYLTNPSLSKSLCIPGVGGVKAQNKAGGVVAICRTDYPGTESETIPVELQSGESKELTCPDAATYYTWKGQSTSAQYYLNPIGVPASQGCQWSQAGSNVGNFAPINFGVGFKDGKTWLSIFQNAPTTTAKYQGKVELVGNLSGVCKYENGMYTDAIKGANADGCTVAVISGEATYVVSS